MTAINEHAGISGTAAFHPPVRTLMGPGPSDVSPQVLAAMARPTIGHLDPEFVRLMDEIKGLLQYAFVTKNQLTIPISAPGSAGMEACFVNLVGPGDTVIVCVNGVFGGRMRENAERCGAQVVVVEDKWGEPVSVEKVREAFVANPGIKALAFVHAETSTGVGSDAQALCSIAQEFGALSIVDAVTSLGGSSLKVDEWGVDAVYSGSQKCLSCPPGISPVSFSDRAVAVAKDRKGSIPSWFLDTNLVMGYWAEGTSRSYHHTAPVNSLYALHEGLRLLKNEGLENSWNRHTRLHQALSAGLEAMGLTMLVAPEYRLPQLNAVCVPENIDEAQVRRQLLNDFNLEIGAGLGELQGKVWRIGLMGAACTKRNVLFCLSAIETALRVQGYECKPGEAQKVALEHLQ